MISDMSQSINTARQALITPHCAKQIYSLIDLTSLNDTDNNDTIIQLCKNTQSPLGHVAAICIHPPFIGLAKQLLKDPTIKIATVVNFPEGKSSIDIVGADIKKSIADGADEIDLVFPYEAFIARQTEFAHEFIKQCKLLCGDKITLKVILETGELKSTQLIADASELAINAGADFIKTSTGKTRVGATLEAAYIMLNAIKNASLHGKRVGFKAAGGIRTLAEAAPYINLAEEIMGKKWIAPHTFRFGASSLAVNLINEDQTNKTTSSY